MKEEGGIAILEFDQPDADVNVLNSQNLLELKHLLAEIGSRHDLKAIVITSAKDRIFIAGADIREIEKISSTTDALEKAEQGKVVLKMIEDLEIPTLAVINGACLGGGYELTLACKWRVASSSEKVKIGLPEVNLGVIPGFGGTQRLPRLIGPMKALSVILAGRVVSAQEALKLGMVDRLFPEKVLLKNSIQFTKEIVNRQLTRSKGRSSSWFLEKTPLGRFLVYRQAKKGILRLTKGFYPAPMKALEVIQKTYGREAVCGFRLESEAFAELAVTDISKNLIKLFLANEQYKKFPRTKTHVPPLEIKQCGVIGAGVMGGGIAQLVSDKGIPVRIKDIQPQALGSALKEARTIYDSALKKKKLKRQELDFKMGLISVGLTTQTLRRSQIIIEAVVEDMKVKEKVFGELSQITDRSTILASNTSSLSITRMAEVSRYPERVIGLHFFNPVHKMPLVEIIPTPHTSEEVLAKTIQFARSLGKTVIVVKDVRGFLVNRLLMPYMNEAAYLMEEGCSPATVDQVATDFGMPMGPLELLDFIGIDIAAKVAKILHEAYGERMKCASLMKTVQEKGLLGKKSKRGFYIYKGKKKKPNPDIMTVQKSGVCPSRNDILKRLIYIMINEATRCLEEKVVEESSAIDIAMIMGTGFPPFRGGLLRYADFVGAKNIVDDLKRFRDQQQTDRFSPAPYLLRLSEKHQTFYPI
ncbi:MAG: 3-hydroxyacyl-CoA dehydrogenase NAD-binding domain-containing protein [Candidatus Omnitrophica bacterium]|nr:3-hydroxyacyl-CoA dehydrogenase NAD-binding domain-containing protein [Candidatus Omnitrophota bacterium]